MKEQPNPVRLVSVCKAPGLPSLADASVQIHVFQMVNDYLAGAHRQSAPVGPLTRA